MPAVIDEACLVYASALRELAEGAGGRAKEIEVGEELDSLAALIARDAGFAAFLRSPIIDAERRGESLRRILSGKVSDLILRTLLVMNRRGRSAEIAGLAPAYRALLDARLGRVAVEVVTPAGPPIDESLAALVRERVRSTLGKEAVIEGRKDSRMIGGIKIRIGDVLIDGSVATRLRRMSEELVGRGGPEVRGRFESFVEGGGEGTT
jgi:F-type H+-transporting ATPase subunit delta